MKKIFLLVFIVFYFVSEAQEVELVGLKLYNTFDKNKQPMQRMEIGLFLIDTIQLISLSPKSTIEILKDNKGKDLKIPVYKNELIDFNRSQLFDEGLEILIESKILPSREANNIHIKGKLYYTIVDHQGAESIILENLDFNDLQMLSFSGNNYKLRKSHYNDSKKGAMVAFTFKNNDSLIYISSIEELDNTGKIKNTKIFNRYTNKGTIAFPKVELDNKKYLKITYKRIKLKVIDVDKKFGLGL